MENQITPTSAAKAPATLDAHGFDPNDYDWIPVLRKRRADGWSPDRQRGFIEALADCGSVAQAARDVGMSETSAYRLRRSPGAEGFDRAWSAAIDAASKKLIDSAFERALVGTDEPVFDRDGRRVGRRLRQSDKLLMFLLRAYMPDRFRHAVNDRIPVGEAPAPGLAPVAEALAQMLPELPPEPHMLMAADDLETAIEVADILDGELPHYHRDAKPQTYVPSAMEQALDRKLDEIRRRDVIDEGEYYDDDDEGAMG
jgi:hypothetical protein